MKYVWVLIFHLLIPTPPFPLFGLVTFGAQVFEEAMTYPKSVVEIDTGSVEKTTVDESYFLRKPNCPLFRGKWFQEGDRKIYP